MMLEMDGVQTLKRIRNVDEHIPVIMFTAHPDVESMAGAENLGIISYIPKMSTFSDTQALLRKAINMAVKKIKQ